MFVSSFYYVLEAVIFATLLLAIVYAFGVVWRVEKKLDLAFKLFTLSIISFFIYEVLSVIYPDEKIWIINARLIFKAVFVFLFFFGMVEMRSMLRRLDGEKKEQ